MWNLSITSFKQITAFSIFLFSLLIFNCSENSNSPSGNDDSRPIDEEPPTNENVIQVNKLNDHFTIFSEPIGTSVNATLFSGSEGNLMIDTGYDTMVGELRDSINGINPVGVQFIINTHTDTDHRGGNNVLSGGGTILGHVNGELVYQNSNPGADVLAIDRSYIFNFNGESIRCLLRTNNGHTESDIIVYFPESKIICTGDLYISESFPSVSFARGATVQAHLMTLNYLINYFPDDITYIPGHGRPSTKEELTAYYSMVEATVEIVRNEMATGRSLEDIQRSNVLAEWNSWGTYFVDYNTNSWIRQIYLSYYGL
ncbi:MAG: MBL fold metallo-hydrolase [Bacteroidetes bacterium]|nr:MBL fold metallo-hydrolase [Bacteroidota bacterium]